MKIEIFVVNYDDEPNKPGTAHVFIDGQRHAQLRSGSGYVIETSERIITRDVPGLTRTAVNNKAWDAYR